MASIVSTNMVVARVDTGKDDDMYPVFAWLRDTCIPSVRPLFNEIQAVYSELKAAALVKHNMDDGSEVYELIMRHGCLEKRIRCDGSRRAPSLTDFIRQITGEL